MCYFFIEKSHFYKTVQKLTSFPLQSMFYNNYNPFKNYIMNSWHVREFFKLKLTASFPYCDDVREVFTLKLCPYQKIFFQFDRFWFTGWQGVI